MISLQQVIDNARMVCGVTTKDADTLFYKLAWDAVKRIRSADSVINPEILLPIVNNTAELPLGVTLIECVRFTIGNAVNPSSSAQHNVYPYYRGRNFPLSNSSQNLCQSDFGFDIVDNHLVFDSGVGYNSVWVQYMGLAVDADGFPLISEKMELAVQSFTKWQYALIYPEKYNAALIQMYSQEWRQTYREARSTIPQNIRVNDVGAMWNTIFIRNVGSPYTLMNYGNR